MAVDNRVINPALAQQLFRKSEMLKRKRAGEPASIESFPRVVKTITGLWRYSEGKKYLEELILVEGGKRRFARRHTWRGGHDPEMVKEALEITLEEQPQPKTQQRRFVLTLTNAGADHYVPTGTPDRHLTVELRLLDAGGRVLDEAHHTLKRTIMWRPFIVDLWDTRLLPKEPRTYVFEFNPTREQDAVAVEAVVRYHLLDEARRKRIGYQNEEPIAYEVYRKHVPLSGSTPG